MQRDRLVTLIEIAIMAALSYVMSMVQFSGLWPQGGSVSLVMIPLVILSFRRGVMAGVTAGTIVGILNWIFGGYVIHPIQGILDYPVAFGVLGLAALLHVPGKKSRLETVIIGVVIAGLLRLLSHVLSGVIWFGEYAEGMNVWLYSFLYNGSFIVPEIIISAVIIGILYARFSQLLKTNVQ